MYHGTSQCSCVCYFNSVNEFRNLEISLDLSLYCHKYNFGTNLGSDINRIRKFLNIQALMCVALMSILYHVETSSRSLTQLVTCGQVSNWRLSDLLLVLLLC